jgi:hypothetical protein
MSGLLGNGPLEITSGGRQFLVPLTALELDATGQPKINWPSLSKLSPDDQKALTALIKTQVARGMLTPDTAPPPKPAAVIKATESGPAGNNIQVTFSNFVLDSTNPNNTTFDVTVTEADSYPLLSTDSASASYFRDVLGDGTSAHPGTSPGLVNVKALGSSTKAPAPANYSLDPTAAGTVDVKDGDGNLVVTLVARRSRTTATPAILVQIGKGADDTTFSLTATFTLAKNIKLSELLTVTDFAYLVTFSKPSGATAVGLPAPGAVRLSGGAPAATATQAQATVLSGS